MTPIARSTDTLGPSSALFTDDEPVLQSHALLPGVEVPRFARNDRWEFHAHRRPANTAPSAWEAILPSDPTWNLRTRELLMIMLNPEHPAVLAAGLRPAARRQYSVATVIKTGYDVRELANWALERDLPRDLRLWDADTARFYIEECRARVSPSTVVCHVLLVRLLHRLNPYLTGGGLALDPWPGRSARQVARMTRGPVSTRNIDPDLWFALMRAAYMYVHQFAADILAARDRYRGLLQAAAPTSIGFEESLTRYLADERNLVPTHAADRAGRYPVAAGSVNMDMLCLLMGFQGTAVAPSGAKDRRIRQVIASALSEGRTVTGGLSQPCTQVVRPDGSRGPWHPGIGPFELSTELIQLRNAAYTLVAGLSMMRDSEIREITRGSVVEHYGSPALLSRKRKLDPNVPVERWWIAEPVAEAIVVAEAVSWHGDLIFTGAEKGGSLGLGDGRGGGNFQSRRAVADFIAHVNRGTAHTGLSIPSGRATPQQFRKTMAMLTARRPGGEIAVRHQLKHIASRALANRVTEGYWASDKSWDKLLDTALEDVRIEKLADLYTDHLAGRPIGFGPAAEKLSKAFGAVAAEAEQLRQVGKARQGDARVEFDLLRQARIAIRFGTLNHCTLDDRNPVGAKCLEAGLQLPAGHTGPVQNLCQPGRCANSLIRTEHLPVYQAEHGSLLTLLDNPKLSPPQRGSLQRQLDEVNGVIERTQG